jgi:hypothetical protein
MCRMLNTNIELEYKMTLQCKPQRFPKPLGFYFELLHQECNDGFNITNKPQNPVISLLVQLL